MPGVHIQKVRIENCHCRCHLQESLAEFQASTLSVPLISKMPWPVLLERALSNRLGLEDHGIHSWAPRSSLHLLTSGLDHKCLIQRNRRDERNRNPEQVIVANCQREYAERAVLCNVVVKGSRGSRSICPYPMHCRSSTGDPSKLESEEAPIKVEALRYIR